MTHSRCRWLCVECVTERPGSSRQHTSKYDGLLSRWGDSSRSAWRPRQHHWGSSVNSLASLHRLSNDQRLRFRFPTFLTLIFTRLILHLLTDHFVRQCLYIVGWTLQPIKICSRNYPWFVGWDVRLLANNHSLSRVFLSFSSFFSCRPLGRCVMPDNVFWASSVNSFRHQLKTFLFSYKFSAASFPALENTPLSQQF